MAALDTRPGFRTQNPVTLVQKQAELPLVGMQEEAYCVPGAVLRARLHLLQSSQMYNEAAMTIPLYRGGN